MVQYLHFGILKLPLISCVTFLQRENHRWMIFQLATFFITRGIQCFPVFFFHLAEGSADVWLASDLCTSGPCTMEGRQSTQEMVMVGGFSVELTH
jgi:hypothetical protein